MLFQVWDLERLWLWANSSSGRSVHACSYHEQYVVRSWTRELEAGREAARYLSLSVLCAVLHMGDCIHKL